jgi:hypothetical protein
MGGLGSERPEAWKNLKLVEENHPEQCLPLKISF